MADVRPLVIVGAGGHGRVVLDMAHASSHRIAGFVDSVHEIGSRVNGAEILGDNRLLSDTSFIQAHRFLVAIGNQASRAELAHQLQSGNASFATVIHPSCIISSTSSIDCGTVIVAGAIVNTDARIGRHCIINTGATIDHDVVLEDGVQVSPGANLAGKVYCGENSFIGTGAVVIPGIRIGANTIVGAGSVVVKDVPSDIMVAGNPARPI